MKRRFAIRDNQLITTIDVAPFSKERMDEACKERGFDGWFELDEAGALMLLQVG